jgi:hypothetical protein
MELRLLIYLHLANPIGKHDIYYSLWKIGMTALRFPGGQGVSRDGAQTGSVARQSTRLRGAVDGLTDWERLSSDSGVPCIE